MRATRWSSRPHRDARGAAALELVGVTVAAASMVTGLMASGVINAGEMSGAMREAICRLGGVGACTPDQPPGVPEDPRPTLPPMDPSTRDAVEQLAEMLGVSPADVEVVTVEQVTWNDGSIGCARRGNSYTYALVDGQRIVLRINGRTYHFHSGRDGVPRYCAHPTG